MCNERFYFSINNDEPKHKQIYQQIKALIEQGNVQSDDSLHLFEGWDTIQVSWNTTLTAYDRWLQGLYLREGRKGYYVNALEQVF